MIDIIDYSYSAECKALNFLLLEASDEGYCTASHDWAQVIKKTHKNTISFKYTHLYQDYGERVFFDKLDKIIAENDIHVLYFTTPIRRAVCLDRLEKLREKCFIVVTLDDNALFFDDWFKYTTQVVDLVITHDYVEKYRYNLFGVSAMFVPQVSDLPRLYQSNVNILDKDIIISSVGRVDRVGRKEFIDSVLNAGVPLQLFGPGTPGGFVSKERKIEIYQRSIMSLNFSGCAEYFHGKHVRQIDKKIKQVKGRLWELALSKTLILTEKAPNLEQSFVPGRELVVYDDEKDLLEKIKYFQEHQNEAIEIALNGYNRAKLDLNPTDTVKKIISRINLDRKNKVYRKNEIITDKLFLTSVYQDKAELTAASRTRLQSLKSTLRQFVSDGVPANLMFTFCRVFISEVTRTWLKRSQLLVKLVRKVKKIGQ